MAPDANPGARLKDNKIAQWIREATEDSNMVFLVVGHPSVLLALDVVSFFPLFILVF
jgi:hypothetical protein